MKSDLKTTYAQVRRDKQINGLWFGLLVGLAFALGTWGLDAYLLFRAHSEYSWVKLLLGLPFSLCIAGLSGWLAVKVDNGLASFVFWLIVGIGFVFVASHIPYEAFSTFLTQSNPEYQRTTVYPFVQSARVRMGLLYFIVGGLTAIAGTLEFFFVDAASRASFQATKWLTLLSAMLVFAPIGLLSDNLINQPLRAPILGIDRLLKNGIEAIEQPVTREKARDMGLRSLKPFGDLITRPYRLVLGNYDPESQSETTVFVKFIKDEEIVWGNCFVIDGFPSFCQLSTDLFIERLYCLLESSDQKICRLKYGPGTEDVLDDIREKFGARPQADIYDQRGTLVLVTLYGSDQSQVQCELQVVGNVVIKGCDFVEGRVFEPGLKPEPVPLEQTAVATDRALEGDQVLLSSVEPGLTKIQDAPQYIIHIEINPESLTYKGQLRLDYTNTESVALPYLIFRLMPNGQGSFGNGSLDVTSVLIDDRAVIPQMSGDDTVLQADFSAPLASGQKARIDFEFRGKIPRDFGGDETSAAYGIFNMSDNVLALSAWYPILAVYDEQGWSLNPSSDIGDSIYSDTALYSVSLQIPEEFQVVTTGIEKKRELLGNMQKIQFDSGPARDFFIVASPNFEKVSREVNGTLINVYYLPDHKRSGEQALVIAGDSLQIFNQKFGSYPYNELDIVEAPMRNALGVEFPAIILMSNELFDTPDTPEFAVTVAHEVSHQWWYAVVGNDVFDEPWLDESLATYSSSLYYEFGPARKVPSPLISYWQKRYDKFVQDGQDEVITQPLEYFESLANPNIYAGVAYTKGALFFNSLRQEIGDEAFFAGLQAYYRSNAFAIATARDLLQAFEETSGRSLEPFYQGWLYSKKP